MEAVMGWLVKMGVLVAVTRRVTYKKKRNSHTTGVGNSILQEVGLKEMAVVLGGARRSEIEDQTAKTEALEWKGSPFSFFSGIPNGLEL